MIKPVIVVTHASFDERRRRALRGLVQQLHAEAPGIPFFIAEDSERRGSMWCWSQAMALGLRSDATHFIGIPDDAILCKDFGKIIRACIEARPDDVFDCFVNHSLAQDLKSLWYTTPDGGLMLFGGVFPRKLAVEHFRWRNSVGLRDDFTNDGGVNLWAMHTGRRVYHTAFTLVQQDATLPSLDGHDSDDFRTGLRWMDDFRGGILGDTPNLLLRTYMMNAEGGSPSPMRQSTTELPNTYRGNHWYLVSELPPENWKLDTMYSVARSGQPLEPRSLLILTPTYRIASEMLEKTRDSVEKVRAHLGEHGIQSGYAELRGDALVCRMRQRGCNIFLKSPATHLLFWDGDIECLTPEAVLAMMDSGKGVISGLVPFKNGTGDVVCNLLGEDVERMNAGGSLVVENGCVEVQDAGSGFMLVTREALYKMQMAYPELLHFSASKADHGEPLWALFDTKVVDRLYRSEDYYFCHLWRELGERVYAYEPARFKHYGLWGYTGSLRKQYGLENANEAPGG